MERFILKTLAVSSFFALQAQAQTQQDGVRALDFNKYEYARNTFASLTKNEPANGDNWYYLGQAYLNLYKEDSAKWAYNEGIKIAPNTASNHIGLGELLMAENKQTDANAKFTQALSFNKGRDGSPKDARALRMVAAALVSTENKNTTDALKYISAAIELAPNDYETLITAGDVYLEMNKGGDAATNYERAQRVEPKNPKAFAKAAIIWIRVRNAETALTDLNKALALDPNYAPALKLMSELYYKSKKYDKAKEYYTQYLQNSEASVANKIRFAKLLFSSEEYTDALSQILDILKVDQSDVYLYRLAGYSYYEVAEKNKDTSYYRLGVDAMNTFISKIDAKKVLPNDYEYLGKLYSRINGQDSLAIAYITQAIELAPEKVELIKEKANILQRIRKYDEAALAFEQYIAVAKKPNVADYYLLGFNAYYGKLVSKADSAFIKVIELKPDYADGYYWRGNTQAFLDVEANDTIAKNSYETYISYAESNAEKNKSKLITAYDYLAKYFIKKEQNATAKTYLNKIIALDPTNKTAKEYLQQLK